MTFSSATLGLGYAALVVATVMQGWAVVRRARPAGFAGQVLAAIATVLLWAYMLNRASAGRGWPFVSPADTAAGIALLMLAFHLVWTLVPEQQDIGLSVAATALVLFTYALIKNPQAYVTSPIVSTGTLLSAALNLCGGGFLALAAATGLTNLGRALFRPDPAAPPADSQDRISESLVRGALFCLAISLAIDTWWLQKVGLGNSDDAQQAGIAIAWMIYFVALRLRSSPRWRGWPWAAMLIVGFICVLPILVRAAWLESTLFI